MNILKVTKKKYSHKNWYSSLPDENESVNEDNLKLFFKTMFERQEIWFKRFILKQDAPWTKDDLFVNNKFTNVYRELDRNSQWLINNVLKIEKDTKQIIWKILLFRIHNCIEFMEWIQEQENSFQGTLPNYDEYNKREWNNLIVNFRKSGGNPYTNAYLINSMACPGCTRDECYGNKVVPTLHKAVLVLNKIFIKSTTPEEIINYLNTLPAVSNFVSHEFYQDFTYIKRYLGKDIFPFDQNDFTNVGPGCEVGLRLIFPSLTTNKKEGIHILRDIAEQELIKYGNFKYLEYNIKDDKYYTTNNCNITLHQIEMFLCEFQKYWKMMVGLGKQRSKFIPKTKI